MPIARAGDIDLEYYVEGSGLPLLMLMGFAGSAHTWGQPFVDELNKSFTTIRVSNRGTGNSFKPADQFTVRDMADDAKHLLDVLGIDQAHVLGISMGGMIAQEFALAYPERIHGLVLGCTTLGAPNAIAADPETNASMTPEPGMAPQDIIRKSWYALVSDPFVSEGHDFLEGLIVTFMKYPTPMDTIMKQVMAIMGFSTGDRASGISAPTLVIHGDVDRLVPPANGDKVTAAIPGARLHTIPGAAHMFFWEQPQASAAATTEFLARVPARV